MNTDKEFQIPDSKFQKRAMRAVCLCGAVVLIAAAALAQQQKAPQKLDLNTATVEQLDTLPEVGPAVAQRIVKFREKSGPFRRVEELLAVPGITRRRLEKIRPLVEVKGQEVKEVKEESPVCGGEGD